MAGLISYLSDRTAYAGFDVPPTQPRLGGAFFAPLDFLRREPPPGQSLNPRRSLKETPLPDSKGAEPLQSVNRSSTIRCHL
jgi:hypothetical protein